MERTRKQTIALQMRSDVTGMFFTSKETNEDEEGKDALHFFLHLFFKISHGFTSMYFTELIGIFLSLSFSGLFITFLLI